MAEKAENPTILTPSPPPSFLEKETEGRAPGDLPHPHRPTPNTASPRSTQAARTPRSAPRCCCLASPLPPTTGVLEVRERHHPPPPRASPQCRGQLHFLRLPLNGGVPQGPILSSLFFSQQHSLEELDTRPGPHRPLTCPQGHTSMPPLPSASISTCPYSPLRVLQASEEKNTQN